MDGIRDVERRMSEPEESLKVEAFASSDLSEKTARVLWNRKLWSGFREKEVGFLRRLRKVRTVPSMNEEVNVVVSQLEEDVAVMCW